MTETRHLTRDQLQKVFHELKAGKMRDFISFYDFKQAIITYNIPLMKGLKSSDLEFNDYCKELFITICKYKYEPKKNEDSKGKQPR